MHQPAQRGGGLGIRTAGQQRVGETQVLARDLDDPGTFRVLQQRDHLVQFRLGHCRQRRHRGGGQAGRGQQHPLRPVGEAGDAGPDEVGQRGGQLTRPALGRTREFDRVEGVSARLAVYPHHLAPGQWAGEPAGQHLTQRTEAERPDVEPVDPGGIVQLELGHRGSPFTSARTVARKPIRPVHRRAAEEMTSRLGGSSHCRSSMAHQDGGHLREPVEHRAHRGDDRALPGDRIAVGGRRQHPVDRESLRARLPSKAVSSRARSRSASAEYVPADPVDCARVLRTRNPTSVAHTAQASPQRGLPDARFADEAEPRALRGLGQEGADRAELGLPADDFVPPPRDTLSRR